MRGAWPALGICGVLFSGCGPEPKAAPAAAVETAAKPADESSRFPAAGRVDTKVIGQHLLGKQFMPGGTVAHYRKGGVEFDLFAAKLGSATDSAILLPDWRKALTGAELVPSFGGYFGKDAAGVPVFVFAKREWIAGVAGLPKNEADREARVLAAALR